jgi:hypothetical protein
MSRCWAASRAADGLVGGESGRPRHAPPLEHALACLLTDLLGPVWARSPGDADAAARVLDDVAQTIERELHLVPFDPPPAASRTSRRRPGCG